MPITDDTALLNVITHERRIEYTDKHSERLCSEKKGLHLNIKKTKIIDETKCLESTTVIKYMLKK